MEFKNFLFLLNGSSSSGGRKTTTNNDKLNKKVFYLKNYNMVNKSILRINSHNIFSNMFILQYCRFISFFIILMLFNRTANGNCLFNGIEYKVI